MNSFSYKEIIHLRKEGAGIYINMTPFVEGLVTVRKEPTKFFYSKKIHISRKCSVIPSSYTWRPTEKWLLHYKWPFLRGSFFVQEVWYSDGLKKYFKNNILNNLEFSLYGVFRRESCVAVFVVHFVFYFNVAHIKKCRRTK